MNEVKVAKLFRNGGSQAVRLPAEFRFEGDAVYIRKGDRAGELVISDRAGGSFGRFLDRAGALEDDLDFDLGRDQLDEALDNRNLFDENDQEYEAS